MKPLVVVYSVSDLSRDPRVFRQIESLSHDYRVVAFGTKHPGIPVYKFVDLTVTPYFHPIQDLLNRLRDRQQPLIQRFLAGTWLAAKVLLLLLPGGLKDLADRILFGRRTSHRIRCLHPSVILANDISGLSVCANAKHGPTKLIYDAHEYSMGQNTRSWKATRQRQWVDFVLRRYLARCDSTMTIGFGIAELYEKRYGITPVVITNAPYYEPDLSPRVPSEGRLRLVHHGLAARKRNLELMIEVVKRLDERFTLDLFLVSREPAYDQELRAVASDCPRVRFNKPVPMRDLSKTLNQFDIGIRFYPATTLNLKHGLPNKFFEYVQARLMVAVGPTPETKRFVDRYGFGVMSKDFQVESMVEVLGRLTPEVVLEYKKRSDACARELSAEPNLLRIKEMVDRLVQQSQGGDQ